MSLPKKLPVFLSGPYAWWRLSTFVMLGLMAASLLYSGFFVYNYTFRSLEDAHTIVLLNTDSIVNTINLENYEKAVKILELKTSSSTIPVNIRNIFVYDTSFPTSSTSTIPYATSTKPAA